MSDKREKSDDPWLRMRRSDLTFHKLAGEIMLKWEQNSFVSDLGPNYDLEALRSDALKLESCVQRIIKACDEMIDDD